MATESGDDCRTVLAVDDEADLLEAVRRVLTRHGHLVLCATTVADAAELCRTHTGPIDLLLSDLRMPGGGGRELADLAREVRPGLAVLFMSGLADSSGLVGAGVDAPLDAPIIGKPFTPQGLAQAVEAALTGARHGG